jgi:hypothetical protein
MCLISMALERVIVGRMAVRQPTKLNVSAFGYLRRSRAHDRQGLGLNPLVPIRSRVVPIGAEAHCLPCQAWRLWNGGRW